MTKRNIGILLFDDAEVLDFAGPFEVFSVTSELNNFEPFNVFTVAEEQVPIRAVNGLSVNPTYSFNSCPKIDILIISGGSGTRAQMENTALLAWIGSIHQHTELTLSICSGSRLLGVLGLLDGKPYCTHHDVYEHMKEIVPNGLPQMDKRFIQSGKLFTSGGISAGIDLSFHIVSQLLGQDTAERTASYMEYDWKKDR